ncbi:MAG: hypothetical protein KDD61_11725 [Bdellovibrionales bacterium]|nr:hypothetical protein [Bdellovibrionales bacterium]
MIRSLALLILFVFTTATYADPYANLPGAIPLHPSLKPSSDLVYQGQPITSQDALLLKEQGVDLSQLDPEETEIWNPEFINQSQLVSDKDSGEHLKDVSDEMDIQLDGEGFELIDFIPTQIGAVRLSVRSLKNGQTYVIMFGNTAHNVLLRRALLRKIGYYIAPVQYLKSYSVRFSGGFTLSQFLNGAKADEGGSALFPSIPFQTNSAPNRWATNIVGSVNSTKPDDESSSQKIRWEISNDKDKNDFVLRLQDAVIFTSENRMYNLSRGYVSRGMIRNRRAMNATFVPLALVEATESVNLFPWEIGKQINGQLSLVSRSREEFSTTLEDLLWVSRKLLKLDRQDFEEVVAQAYLPKEVSLLLVEKLISRRNSLRHFLKLEHGTPVPENYKSVFRQSSDLKVNSKISYGNDLADGKLTKEDWPGYASRFSYGEPDAFLSKEELLAFGKSKILSNTVSNLLTEVNHTIFPNVNDVIGKAAVDHQIDLAVEQFVDYIRTGKASKVKFGFWTKPYATGNLIVSREIVMGSYLGTDNSVQLADTVGFAAVGGLFIGTHGLPSQSMYASGKVEGQLVRQYTRLKPIKSMKRALEEPFKNPILPFILRGDLPELFEQFISSDSSTEDKEKAQKAMDDFFKTFGKNLEVGESLLISDALSGLTGLTVGYSLAERIKFQVEFEASLRVLKRLHIHRKDEHSMQIYDDKGNVGAFRIAAGFHSGVLPILEFNIKWNTGTARTEFYNLNFDPNLGTNPDFRTNVVALRDVLFEKDLGSLKAHYAPYVLEHDFDQSVSGIQFLIWKRKGLDSQDLVTITSPSGYSSDYVTSTTGVRHGIDYQSTAINVINELISYYSDSEVVIASTFSGDPGDTIFGHSNARQVTFDAKSVKIESPYRVDLAEKFAHIQYRWKGWETDQKGARSILKEINNKVQFPLIPDSSFNETKALQLYRFDLNILFYQAAIEKVLAVHENVIEKMYSKYGILDSFSNSEDSIIQEDWQRSNLAYQFSKLRKKYVKELKKGRSKEAASYGAELFDHLEKSLPLPQIIQLVGGAENIYITASVNGFRKGDDNGDRPIYSNDLGRYGSKKRYGPLNYIMSNTNMTASEFYIQWIMEKL